MSITFLGLDHQIRAHTVQGKMTGIKCYQIVIFGLVILIPLLLLIQNGYVNFAFMPLTDFRGQVKQTQLISSQLNNSNPQPPIKVHCMLFTTMSTWKTKARAVRNTWAKRCYRLSVFYSKINNASIEGAIDLPVAEGRQHLTDKTFHAINHTYSLYGNDIDWILKADDDVYIIWENFIRTLSKYNSSEHHYVGSVIHNFFPHGYNSGGASYSLSRTAARLLHDDFNNKVNPRCRHSGGIEDKDIGQCLSYYDVFPENTLDKNGDLTFHSQNPFPDMAKNEGKLYITKDNIEMRNPKRGGIISPEAVSFHYVRPYEIYTLEYLLYDLKRG